MPQDKQPQHQHKVKQLTVVDNDCVECTKCPNLSGCCNGSFEGPYRKLVREDEANAYGRKHLEPLEGYPGWYSHEHFGRCPHAHARTGLCDIHANKPLWCKLFPVTFNVKGQTVLQPTCVAFIKSVNLDKAVKQVKSVFDIYKPIKDQLLAMADMLTTEAREGSVPGWAGGQGVIPSCRPKK